MAKSRSRSRTRSSGPRSTRTTTTTRTLRSVYMPKKSNTPYVVGAGLLAGAAALYLLSRPAMAATPAPLPPGPGPGVPPIPPAGGTVVIPPNPNFPQISGASLGYSGPGGYRVTAPNGLRIRSTAAVSGADRGLLPSGTPVTVVGDGGGGWLQVSAPQAGFMCASCPEGQVGVQGGPWLVRQS